ncbi:hypothetical protein G6F62_014827 [Rhizopus arrhizus]|nr:hypothetical protein G6F62_014827 [Rhizopus arrhizus]
MPAATPASSSAARITPGPSSWTAAIWACRSSKAWRVRPTTPPTPRFRCAVWRAWKATAASCSPARRRKARH